MRTIILKPNITYTPIAFFRQMTCCFPWLASRSPWVCHHHCPIPSLSCFGVRPLWAEQWKTFRSSLARSTTRNNGSIRNQQPFQYNQALAIPFVGDTVFTSYPPIVLGAISPAVSGWSTDPGPTSRVLGHAGKRLRPGL